MSNIIQELENEQMEKKDNTATHKAQPIKHYVANFRFG